MIELPRAALTADQIAEDGRVLQLRHERPDADDAGHAAATTTAASSPYYRENDIMPDDPFQTIDQDGVGELMKIGVERGRSTRPDLKIGICGEHGGDPASVIFCHEIGLNYVSCSPFRVPIARLAAAQAALADQAGASAAATTA